MTVDLETGKSIVLTKEQERAMLQRHGTAAWKLSAKNLLQAAERDIRALRRNAERRKDRALGFDSEPLEKLIFLEIHVIGHSSPKQVLEAAINGQNLGRDSTRRDTLLVYENLDLLKAALDLCK